MDLIIETDLGHDPDDYFALCWLVATGVKIRAITLVPGDLDQLALARFLIDELQLDCPLGASRLNRTKESSWGMHHELLKKYDRSLKSVADGYGVEVVEVHKQYPDSEFFVIGPVSSVGKYLRDYPNLQIRSATMQGGFLEYDLHSFPCKRLDKFEGYMWQPTYNLNGDRSGGQWFMEANIAVRRFIPKSLTHTIVYDGHIHQRLQIKNRASELFKEGMDLYLQKHPKKKFHDPAAAVCHLKPEIASWVRGKIIKMGLGGDAILDKKNDNDYSADNIIKMESGWGTILDEKGDYIAADINYEEFWNCITEFCFN